MIKSVTRTLHRSRCHYPSKRNHRHVSRPPTDIDNHMSHRFMDRDPRTDSCQDRLLYHIRIFCSCLDRSFYHRSTLRRCDPRWHGYKHFWFDKIPLTESFVYIVAKHRFRHSIVCNHPIFHRSICNNRFWCTPDHLFCFDTDCKYLIILF